MPPVIEASGLTKLYAPGAGVDGLDLSIGEGRLVGVIGPSGAGKTTSIRLFTGLERPDRGRVRVLGEDPDRFSREARTRLGYLPQDSVMYPELSLSENLRFAAGLHGMRRRHRDRRVADLFELLELGEATDTRLRDASGGQRRRLGLAIALVHQPSLAFLDEPTAALDPLLRRKLWGWFGELRDEGRTILVTTQYVGEAAYCDEIVFLSVGTVAASGPPDVLRREAFGGELFDVTFDRAPTEREIERITRGLAASHQQAVGPRRVRFTVEDAGSAAPRLSELMNDADLEVVEAERHLPEFDEVFVVVVEQDGDRTPS